MDSSIPFHPSPSIPIHFIRFIQPVQLTGAAFLETFLLFFPKEKVMVGAWKAAAEPARARTETASFILDG
jgi:hypothetical protein